MIEQIGINSIISASVVVLAGVSFFVPFAVSRFFHFTHGAAYIVGAYSCYVLLDRAQMPLPIAVIASVLAAGAFGLLMDCLVYGQLRHKGAGSLALLIASLGLYVLVQNGVSLLVGDSAVSLDVNHDWQVYSVFGARITQAQMLEVATAILSLIALWIVLHKTTVGLQMRAVGQNAVLAQCIGIRQHRTISIAFASSYGLAGLAGVLLALDVDAVPTMGMRPMMLGMVAMIIGGNTLLGTVCGAVFVGFVLHLGVIWLPTQWQDAIAYVVLLVFLLFRPGGFVGKPVKTVSV
jgi:branched-chain amino acid transport system permease protein